mgnify:CR=1 FL=1
MVAGQGQGRGTTERRRARGAARWGAVGGTMGLAWRMERAARAARLAPPSGAGGALQAGGASREGLRRRRCVPEVVGVLRPGRCRSAGFVLWVGGANSLPYE